MQRCPERVDGGSTRSSTQTSELKLLLIFLLFAAGIVAASYIYFCQHKKAHYAEVDRQLTSIAELKVGELKQWREDRQTDASIFFKNPTFTALVSRIFKSPGDSDAQRQLHDWLGKYATMEDYNQVRLLDVEGNSRLILPAGGAQAVSEAVLKAASEVLLSGKISLRDFYLNEHEQRVYLAALVPLFEETEANRPLGVLVLRIDPKKYLYPFVQRWPTPSATAETQLVWREENEAIFLADMRCQTNAFHKLRISLKRNEFIAVKAVSGQKGIVSDALDYRGVPVIAYVHPVPESPWFLVAKIDRDEIMAPLRVQLLQLVLMVSVLIFGAGAGVALIWRQQRIRFYQEEIRVAQKLLQSENQYRELFESSADALFLIDEDTSRFINANNMATVLYGYELDELLAKKNSELSAEPEESNRFFQETKFKPGQVFHVPFRLHRKKDGTVFPVEINARSLISNAKGVLLVACRDISVRHQAEEALKTERLQLRTLIDNLPYSVFFKDKESRFVVVNQPLAQYVGESSRDAMIGRDDTRYYPAELAREFRDEELRIMREGVGVYGKEEWIKLANVDDQQCIATTKVPIKNGNGDVIGLAGICIDVTANKRLEVLRKMGLDVMRLLNEPGDLPEVLQSVIAAMKAQTGFDAVGLRLQEGEDFPYFAQQGLTPVFLATENTLIACGMDGRVCRDTDGNACLECLCGLVISGKTDPANPLFTRGGSFWTNNSNRLLNLTAEQYPWLLPRNQCVHDGYSSMALIPIRNKDHIIGLIQFVDRRLGRFTLENIEQLENIAAYIGEALMRKRAEADLVKQNGMVRTLLDNLQIGVYMIEVPSGKPLLANEASFKLLGRGIIQKVHASEIAQVYAVYKGDTQEPYPSDELPLVVAMRGASKHVDDVVVVKPDGTRVTLEVFGSPIKDQRGNVWASLVSFQDITERKAAEKALQEMAESKSKFTSTVSHELRSPLAMIKEATNLVLDGVLGPVNDEQKEMLDIAKNSIARLGRLVNNVLVLQKMEARKMEYNRLEQDINELVKEANVGALLFAGDRKADLVMDLGNDLPRITFDYDKIMQVLINLLANAVKYSESGPVVTRTRLENGEIHVSVEDSGQGIHPDDREEIFKPFSQGKRRGKGGTGLGLAIAKEIVLSHQGRIWVESEMGKGSIFHFALPITLQE